MIPGKMRGAKGVFASPAASGGPSNVKPQERGAIGLVSKDMPRRKATDFHPKMARGVNRRIGRSGR